MRFLGGGSTIKIVFFFFFEDKAQFRIEPRIQWYATICVVINFWF
jgi:hypothetical protein